MFKSVICALHKFAICNDAASSELAANLTAVSTPPVIVSPPIQKVTNFPNFPFNEDKRLTHNLLVYQDTPACATLAQDLANHDSYKRVTAPVSAEFHHAFFDKEPVEGKCEVACLDLGSPEHLVTRVFPERIHNLEPVESSHVSWYQKQCQAKELGIVNTGYETVNIFWVNQDSQRVKVGSISNGEKHTFWTGTYLGHVFEVTDASNDQLLESVTIQCDTFIPVGGLLNGVDPNFVPAGYPDLNTAVRNTLDIEWGRHNAVTRHFTDVGFAKGRLPTDLFCSMTTYYYNNRNNRMREEWKSKGLFVNWWVVDAHFIPMPHTLKVFNKYYYIISDYFLS